MRRGRGCCSREGRIGGKDVVEMAVVVASGRSSTAGHFDG